jgi:DNA-directed RNA polymerase subunit RPC12/RpoP
MTMPDKMMICKDCGAEFTFTEGEQAFYKEKGFENEPTRCPDCRKARKNARRQQQGGYDNRY